MALLEDVTTPAPVACPPVDQRAARRPGVARAVKIGLSGGLAIGVVALLLPRVAGVDWRQIGSALTTLTPWQVALLAAVWMLGLWVHTLALTAAMPGLSSARALLLNLTGSFVSNLLPFGGAAGTVANYSMSRSWGFSPAAFARWALVTNLWDTMVKLALPGVALCWLAFAHAGSGASITGAALAGGGALVALVAATAFLARSEAAVHAVGRRADALARRLRREPSVDGPYAAQAVAFRRDSAALVRSAWVPLTVGKVAYAALQAALLWLSLHLLGSTLGPAPIFAAFAAERILSMAVITPGATGVVEVGMTGVLLAMHGDPAVTAAGVLLYRGFTFGMEIPVGGLGMLWWAARRNP